MLRLTLLVLALAFGATAFAQPKLIAIANFGEHLRPGQVHNYNGMGYDLAFQTVPEPATLGVLALGGLAALRRRRRVGA